MKTLNVDLGEQVIQYLLGPVYLKIRIYYPNFLTKVEQLWLLILWSRPSISKNKNVFRFAL